MSFFVLAGVTRECLTDRALINQAPLNRRNELNDQYPAILIEQAWSINDLSLALINRAGSLYGRILTEVVSTDRAQ